MNAETKLREAMLADAEVMRKRFTAEAVADCPPAYVAKRPRYTVGRPRGHRSQKRIAILQLLQQRVRSPEIARRVGVSKGFVSMVKGGYR